MGWGLESCVEEWGGHVSEAVAWYPIPMITPLVLACVVALSLFWVGRDAKGRGRSALRIVLLCFLTWPLGFAIWRGIRPPPEMR